MLLDGRPITSVRHVWNVGPYGEIVDTTNRPMALFGQDVEYTYVPDDVKHNAERRLLEGMIGPPADYDDSPGAQLEGDQAVADRLDELGELGS